MSGRDVRATPEEIQAVQPFSRILVEDYGYKKSNLVTHPQYRVKTRPSDKKGYPMDITVFEEGHIKMIVECKKLEEKLDSGDEKQLQLYMSFSGAEIGVLYNGENSIYIRRIRNGNTDDFERIPAIPRAGERLEEIGQYKKGNLQPTHNLKSIFKEIRGWVVANGNEVRDEVIASQIILLILCKIYDEKFTPVNDNLMFRATLTDSDEAIKERVQRLFQQTKEKYNDVITEEDKITFDGKTLRGVIGRLQKYNMIESDRDCIADAFEVFIDKAVKESEGQFFTPRNVIQVMIEAVGLTRDMKVIDSACGSGGFLVETLRKIEEEVEKVGNQCGWSREAKIEEIKEKAIKNIKGLEKDSFLTKLSKSYMAILGDGKGGIFCEDSLNVPSKWQTKTRGEIILGSFDVCLANPPFGKGIKVEGKEKLEQYTLAHKVDKKGQRKLQSKGKVSSLFLERNLQLIKQGGSIGIILPEPYFANPEYYEAMNLMTQGNNIKWVIDLPQNTFRPHNNAKCCAIILQKGVPQQDYIFMAVLDNIGHNHQGKPMYDANNEIIDDAPQVCKEIAERNSNNGELINNYDYPRTFKIESSKVIQSKILVPRFHWSQRKKEIIQEAHSKGIELIPLRKLIDDKVIRVFDGHGSPSAEWKGTGDIPYVRVKDIVNWQVYTDVTSLIPRDVYNEIFRENKALKPKDILYVSRGSYRIGSVAMVSPYDGEMLLTREIKVIRFLKQENQYGITPEYLCYALSHRLVWEQTKSMIFYEPCLPNIADRWLDILIPIFTDKSEFVELKEKVSSVFEQIWSAQKTIGALRRSSDAFLV